jgi:hypothetical protein
MRDPLSKIQVLIFIMINLLALLIISWGYIYYRIKKTASNEVLIAGKIQQLKEMFSKYKKDAGNTPIAIEEFKLQQECIANLQAINQQQQDAMAEIEVIENNDSLDHETKERYIKAQLASLKAQSNAYEDTVSILRKQIRQGNNRLTFIEEKLLIQKQELIKLRLLRDKSEMDNLNTNEFNASNTNSSNTHDSKLDSENLDSNNQIENQENSNSILNEMSVTITQQKQKIENQNSELEQLMQGYLILEEESKNATSADSDTDIDMTSISNDISEIEQALERALTEKNFLETQFLDLLDSNDNQVQLKDELKRTKTEYMMLEEHFIDLAEKE